MRELHGPYGSAAILVVKDPSGNESELKVPRSRPPGEVITFGNLPPFASEFEERTVFDARWQTCWLHRIQHLDAGTR